MKPRSLDPVMSYFEGFRHGREDRRTEWERFFDNVQAVTMLWAYWQLQTERWARGQWWTLGHNLKLTMDGEELRAMLQEFCDKGHSIEREARARKLLANP